MRSTDFEQWVAENGVMKAAELISSRCDGDEQVSYQLIQYWVRKGIPPKHVQKVHAVTGIAPARLRPDIFEAA